MSLPSETRVVLLDVEGTTTPITFVTETLFPFARRRLEAACDNPADPRIREAVAQLREEHAQDLALGERLPEFGNGAPYAAHLMDQDRKSTGLKALQGVIWEAGYQSGDLRGDVFPDVPEAFAAWHRAGLRVAIYSSGSVLAQKLLFAHTRHGDLTRLLSGHYDTRMGAKREVASYRNIAVDLGVPAEFVLFLSDVVEELDAAREAGYRTGLLRRPGNAPAAANGHPEHPDFRGLIPAA